MIGINLNAAKSFFNDKPVTSRVDAVTATAYKRFGAFVRSDARASIRKVGKRGRPSSPESPPKSRVGTLKALIYFVYSTFTRSVVIGPLVSRRAGLSHEPEQSMTVPEVLEHGGSVRLIEVERWPGGPWMPISARSRRTGARRSRSVAIAARPYMGPAHNKSLDKLDEIWNYARKRHEK